MYAELTSPETQFNQVRLEAGDHLLVMRCVRGAIEGSGSYRCPNSRVLAELPSKPDIDTVLWTDHGDMAPGIRCSVPCFEFTSR